MIEFIEFIELIESVENAENVENDDDDGDGEKSMPVNVDRPNTKHTTCSWHCELEWRRSG